MSALADAALRYATRGWSVFPCHTPTATGGCSCGEPGCENQGKHPRIGWKAGATTDPKVIARWWRRWPDANIGIACGARSGIVVLDVDGQEGQATIDARGGTEHGPLVATGRGEHRYLAHPGRAVKNFVKRDGLDLRGDGGYVVAPPSRHYKGGQYQWVESTFDLPLPAMPAWLLDMLPEETTETPRADRPAAAQSARTLAYASKVFENELVTLSEAVNGTRNQTLNDTALKLGHIVGAGWLDQGSVEHALLMMANQIGLPRHEAALTIKSGLTAGMKNPTVLEDRPQEPDDPAYGLKGIKAKGAGKSPPGDTPNPVHWLDRLVDAADYPGKEFPPLRWAVPGLLPEGCFLFAGAPKTGKSWVALQIALAVATGGLLFGKIQVQQAEVLYLDLESNQRRMKSRLSAMITDDQWPARGMLMITNEIERLPNLIDRLDEWMVRKPNTRLIVIDIFENIRPDDMNVKNANLYRLDYNSIRLLTRWADAYHVTILMLHHTNKMHSPDNQFNKISGSTGLTGATSGAWVMGHTEKDEYVLKVQGRDLESSDDLFLKWDSFLCQHQLVGNGALYSIGGERKAILDLMDNDQEWSPRELADETGKPVTAIGYLLRALVADKLVEKSSYGKYAKVRQRKTYGLNIPQTPQSPKTTQSTQTPQSPKSSAKVDSPTINKVDKSEGFTSKSWGSESGQTQSSFASQSHKNGKNPNSWGSEGYSRNSRVDSSVLNREVDSSTIKKSEYDHDKQREQEAIAAVARKDWKAARRASAVIRGRKDQERVEEMIDSAERDSKASGGYTAVEGY